MFNRIRESMLFTKVFFINSLYDVEIIFFGLYFTESFYNEMMIYVKCTFNTSFVIIIQFLSFVVG